jgi:tetratricopeptide (TPR) repeat protein
MRLPAVILLLAGCLRAADCVPSRLGEQEKLARLKQLDAAAQDAFDHRQFSVAAQRYRDAVCLAPKSARAYYGLGIAEAANNSFPAARRALETAWSLLPENQVPLAMLVRVNVAMKDLEQVKATLRIAAERFPRDGELHSSLARFLAENQLVDLALAEGLRFEQTGAQDTGAAVALAVLENTVGAYDDAIRIASLVEEQPGVADPVKAAAAGVVGLSYENSGRREEAIHHMKLAIQLAPAQENSYVALAYVYEKAQRYKDAVDVLRQGRQQIPGSLELLLPLGSNLIWDHQYDAGIEILNELIGKRPQLIEAYVRLAEAYRLTNQPELEARTMQRLAAVKPDYPMVHVLAARAMMNVDPMNTAAVLSELSKAEKIAPGDADVFYLRGKAYETMNRYREAAAAYEHAIELRPLDPSAYYRLGMAYRNLGQIDRSRQIVERMQHLKQPPAVR